MVVDDTEQARASSWMEMWRTVCRCITMYFQITMSVALRSCLCLLMISSSCIEIPPIVQTFLLELADCESLIPVRLILMYLIIP